MQLSNVVDTFGALLQMHLNGCEEALRAASMEAGASSRLDAEIWQIVGHQVRAGEYNACAESIVYLESGTDRPMRAPLVAPAGPTGAAPLATFDPRRDPDHRAAMEAAREAGQPKLTGAIAWPGLDNESTVVVWYAPVFRRAAVSTREKRAATLRGYVAIPIRVQGIVDALSHQIPHARLSLTAHAGAGDLYETTDTGAEPVHATPPDDSTVEMRERTLRIGGHWWRLRGGLERPPTTSFENMRPSTLALAAGLSLSALLAWSAWLMLTQSARAHALARSYSLEAREREARLRSVLDGTRDAIFTLDAQGNFIGTNQSVHEILGFSEDELRGLHASLLLADEHKEEYRRLWQDFLTRARDGENRRFAAREIELRHRDGHALSVRSSLSLVHTDAGDLVVWVVGDITHEREMERRARETAALNQAIMDAAPIGMVTVGADGIITTANRASHEIYGYDTGELVGHDADSICDTKNATARGAHPMLAAATGPDVRGGAPYEAEWICQRKDGSKFPAGVIALPLRDAAGRPLGGLCMVMDITERRRAAARIEHLALHDSLTGLANRVQLQSRAEQMLALAQRDGRGFALALIDIDRFKAINDTLGHIVGDEVLRQIALRLRSAVRDSDTIVRMGGDEFAVLLPEVGNAEIAAKVAQKIVGALSQVLVVEGNRLHVTASIGVSLCPAHGSDLPSLLRSADAAMYDAKARGRDGVSVYHKGMLEGTSDRLELEADLRLAVQRGEFELHYQPIVAAASGKVHALEALLRWCHPRRGLIAPSEFIALAEETGLIVTIGEWVLRRACGDLAQLRSDGHAGLRVAVNLSPRQFTADGLETTVTEALREAGLEGGALELEITESVLMNSVQRTQQVLEALREMGVRVAIDDFGSGYSSLSYLANFPVQTLKVDRSFVRQIDNGKTGAHLAGAIVAIAHSMGLTVVAEGVETQAQRRHLVDLGCEYLQGFLFCRPVPLAQLPETLARVESGARSDQRAMAAVA